MSEQRKRYARGDAHLSVEGTIGTEPDSKVIKTSNGDLPIADFRLVAEPFVPGKGPTEIWFTVKVVGKQVELVEKFHKGDLISARGQLTVRSFETREGKTNIDLICNVDQGTGCIRRLALGRMSKELQSNNPNTQPVETGGSKNSDGSDLFNI